jgi:prepilin-type N-terminal cleavage/methylation domain-containing protein
VSPLIAGAVRTKRVPFAPVNLPFCPMRNGVTLPELMLVLAVAGLLFGITVPGLSGAVDRVEVWSAANHVVAAHRRARMMAITTGQVLVLTVNPDLLTIRPRGQPDAVWAEAGPASSRVKLEGRAQQFTFSPEGLTLGLSNATLKLTRGAATRTIVISRLGRIRIAR